MYMQAFDTAASEFGIPKVLEVADMVLRKVPDRLSVMTYLYQLRAYFTREQQDAAGDGGGGHIVDGRLSTDNTQLHSTSADDRQPSQPSSCHVRR